MMVELNALIWDSLVYILVGIGIFFTVASRGLQLRHFKRMIKALTIKPAKEGHVSSYQAVMLSIGGRVGSGNIIGVAVAITLGGPGAVFWMWMVAFLGMATSFYESVLAQTFKQKEGEDFRGGPAYYIRHGLGKNWSWLAALYSILLLITFGYGFVAMQSFAIAASFEATFDVPTHVTGLGIMFLTGVVIFGGVHRIVHFTDLMVPIMAIGYVLLALYVIGTNITLIPDVVVNIFTSAFKPDAAIGGGIGATIIYGVQRGLFSNEAGLGSAANVAATADVAHPASQGLAQSLTVFIDTIVMCSATAFIILLSTAYTPGLESVNGMLLTQTALNEHIGPYAGTFLTIALFFFVITSIIYNYFMGETALDYFSGENKLAFNMFRISLLGMIYYAAQQDLGTVLSFTDLTMGFIAIVNLLALALLYKVAQRVLRDYDTQIENGVEEPKLDPDTFSDLDIDKKVWKK